MSDLHIYRCSHCGNIILKIYDGKVPIMCCGEPMKELHANTTDAATEKHVPVVEQKEGEINVKVGSVAHPMTEEHWIQWILVETSRGYKIKFLNPGDKPEETFCNEGQVKAVYEYCNLHGLWKKEI